LTSRSNIGSHVFKEKKQVVETLTEC